MYRCMYSCMYISIPAQTHTDIFHSLPQNRPVIVFSTQSSFEDAEYQDLPSSCQIQASS